MGCVNKSSKEFKQLAERNNVSANDLELIVHKYWDATGNEEIFPSDIYVQIQLGRVPYRETGKAVIKLWEREYSSPKTFSSLEEVTKAQKEAERYFPKNVIRYYQNSKGEYTLTVQKPTENSTLTIDDFITENRFGKINMLNRGLADKGWRYKGQSIQKVKREIIAYLKEKNASDTLIDYIKRIPKDNLIEMLSQAEQENRDAELATTDNDIQFMITSEDNPEYNKPQTFTFKDGTKVKAPFMPNSQQADALESMDEFVKSNESSMTLSGYAGTGKTSLMEMFAQKMRKNYRSVIFCATTNKAAAVLKSKVKKYRFDASTLNKVFGISVEVDPNQSYNARNLVNVVKDVEIAPGTTIIIDEASMINEENYEILNTIAQQNGLKIIYVGDPAQLAPVNETKISKVFRDKERRLTQLTQVERTADNAILKEATALREQKPLSKESSFNDKGEGVAYLKQENRQERANVIKHYIQGLRENPDYFRILAYTNDKVAFYNKYVRDLLGYTDATPKVGEPIIGYTNWGYNYVPGGKSYYDFINSESYEVVRVGEPISVSFPINGEKKTMEAIPITLKNSLGEEKTFNLMDIKDNHQNRDVAVELAKIKKVLWERARKLKGRAKAEVLDKINAIEQFLFVNDNITDGKAVLQNKVFDFGYALTVHKSQGSTFTHVLVDDVDIAKAEATSAYNNSWEGVTLGEDELEGSEDTIKGEEEEIELGIDEFQGDNEELFANAQTPEDSQIADIHQQLQYVAVSRATNTVTIVSDNVKKEDSPLNHIEEAATAQETLQQKPVEQMSSKEVWNYLSALQPLTKRGQITYTPQGQEKQTYTVENGHIYNKEEKEIYPEGTVHKTHRNKILANYAIQEGLAVVVKHPTTEEKYVVDNNRQIISVRTGDIMKWDEKNGDRRKIIAQAEKEFRERITATKERGNTLNEQLLDQLQLIGLDIHDETEMAQYLKEHGYKAIQEAIAEQKEIAEIKAKAIADGTFMKAPNGKDTNLTERQWLQVRTKNFINWFGDWINDPANASKVVDENGEPLVVYHHTNDEFTVFDLAKQKYDEFYFTTSESEKRIYSPNRAHKKYHIPVFLNIRTLRYTDTPSGALYENEESANLKRKKIEEHRQLSEKEYNSSSKEEKIRLRATLNSLAQEIKNLKSIKYGTYETYPGGTRVRGVNDIKTAGIKAHLFNDEDFYITFDPNQIKSATDNNGGFSTENDSIQMFIGKKARTQFEQQLIKARPDLAITRRYILNGDIFFEYEGSLHEYGEMSQEDYDKYVKEGLLKKIHEGSYILTEKGKQAAKPETGIDEVLNFLHSLEDNKENTVYIKTAIRWIANRSLTLPQDHTKAYQAFELARKKNLDIQKYKTLGELITAPEMQPKEKEKAKFNPDTAKTFSNKRTVTTEGGRVFTVYDVENTEEGQREVCKALAAHYKMSPWCLSTFTATGEPTQSAKHYWEHYNALPRKIAYENGKPVAFSSDNLDRKGQVRRMTDSEYEEYKNLRNKVSQYEHQRPKLTRRNSNDRENIIKQQEQFDKANPEYIILKRELDDIVNRIQSLDENGIYIYDHVSKQAEAWWDMEDRYPQDKLSDSIVAKPYNAPDNFNWENVDFIDNFIDNREPEPREPSPLEIAQDRYVNTLRDAVFEVVSRIADELNLEYEYGIIQETADQYLRSMNFSINEVTEEMALGNGNEIVELVNQHVNEAFENNVRQTLELYYSLAEEARNTPPVPVAPGNTDEWEDVDIELPFFLTSQGEIKGFATPEGSLYFDRTVMSPEHPIHEYTHLWDRVVAKNNPELWHRGVTLMKKISLWENIENDENYGKKWKDAKGMTPEKLESLIASEIHSRLTGVNGEQILDKLSKEKGQKGIINRLKQWLLDFWKDLKATFSNWSQEDLDKLTLQDFTMMTIRDFADGFNPNTFQQASTQQFVNHSGGAVGSDMYWGQIGEKYGVTSNHYYYSEKTPYGNMEISQQDYEEGRQESAKAAAYNYDYKYATMKDSRLIRNWAQVKYADTIFAIGHLVKPGEKLFPNIPGDTRVAKNAAVTGGTGYAVAMAILHNKPVYVFDQERGKWYKHVDGKWSESDVPTLTPNFAGIGTRNITEAGKKAIEDVYAKTFNRSQQPTQPLSIDNVRNSLIGKEIYVGTKDNEGFHNNELFGKIIDVKKDDKGYLVQVNLDGNEYTIGLNNDLEIRNTNSKFYEILLIPENYTSGDDWLPLKSGINIITSQQSVQQEQQKLDTLKQDLGGGEQATAEIQDAVKVAKKGLSFEEALAGQETFFSKEEQAQIKQGLNGKNLQVMSVSRLTDPAFFSKEIISFLEKNAEKPLNDPTRVTAIEIWSKHDGLPIKDILDACKKYRVAPMASFSITGLGGTALEGGVMKYQDMLEKVGELIKNGTLNPTTTTIRIDPILPGVTNMDDIRKIVETAKSYGIKKFVTSLMQSYGSTENRVSVYNSASKYRYDYYTISNPKDVEKLKVRFPELDITGVKKEKDGSLVLIDSHGNKIESTKFNYDDRKVVLGINNALASEGKTYDWDKYYGRQPWDGKIAFKPKQEVIDEIGKILLELDKDPEITIQTCSFGINGLKVSACLDPMIIERITGVDVLRKDGTYDRDTSRPECMCYGCHGDFFKGQNKKCYSSCAYCYAAHSGDNKLNYYNEDGTLKDNEYTRTERTQPVLQQQGSIAPVRQATPEEVTQIEEIEKSPIETGETEEAVKPYEITLYNLRDWTANRRNPYNTVTVDAKWKEKRLKELDEQLSTENYPEENEDIIREMEQVMRARTKAEMDNPVYKDSEDTKRQLDQYDILSQQIDNLLDSDDISATEIRHTAELIVNAVSDKITELQEKPDETLEKDFPFLNFKDDFDYSKATRKEIVERIGIQNLIDNAKKHFDPSEADYDDIETSNQADIIIDNWDAIMILASDVFVANEGFGINKNWNDGKFITNEAAKIEYTDYNTSQDSDTIKEIEGDEQEHWQVESRTIDTLNSMSAKVRLALHNCYLYDKEGNVIMSKWGIPERVNAREAVNSILRWTQGSQNLQDMIDKLKAKRVKAPWLDQLITKLEGNTDPDLQSQFYSVFQKHFQLYAVVLKEDGQYHSIPVNSHPALTQATNSINALYKMKEHPLFKMQNGKYLLRKDKVGTAENPSPNGEYTLRQGLNELRTIKDALEHGQELSPEMIQTAIKNLGAVSTLLGYTISEGMVEEAISPENIIKMTNNLNTIVKNFEKAIEDGKEYNPFAFDNDNDTTIGGSLRNFLTPLTEPLEDTAVNAFFDSGKMYQSYVTPSFMTKLLNKITSLEGADFEKFMMDEYGNSEWFKNPNKSFAIGWRCPWLERLAKNVDDRKVFDHKVELNFNKHNYMRNMSDAEYTLSLIAEYYAENTRKDQTQVPAWFRIPMQSNKPSSEFIKFYSFRGEGYKDVIVNESVNIFLQEVSRIQTVNRRSLSEDNPSYIKNFDERGKRFNFFPAMNAYLEEGNASQRNLLDTKEKNEDFADLLQKYIDGNTELTADESNKLDTYIKEAIKAEMQLRADSILKNWEDSGIIEAATNIKGIGSKTKKGEQKSDEQKEADLNKARTMIENFIWNDHFAAMNILEMTITDVAFYDGAENLQKRLSQLHAPGVRGNIHATDYKGNPVSDGKYRTVILKDFDTFISNICDNIAEVFDRKIAAAKNEQEKQSLKALKEDLVGEKGKYRNINATDAQGYSSPSSYRKKALIFGKWSKHAEDIYQKMLNNEYTYTDLETAFQPLKPFVYSKLSKNIGVDGAPIQTMKVPFQAKNSEYLLIMADAILKGEELSRPNLLRAIYDVMEESERLNPTMGIDTIQFESAIKSGLQGKINIAQFLSTAGGEKLAYNHMMRQIYKDWQPDVNYKTEGLHPQYNTDTFVHETSYDDYCLQQEVPEHFKDHEQSHGSQIRMITPSDLDYYKNPNGDPNDENNKVYYEFDNNGQHYKLSADEYKDLYENTIAKNINMSIENLRQELHLNSNNRKEQNLALSKILKREILGSPRYGVDLLQACDVDKKTGEFKIPKGDPIQAKRIEQLINSIIKNRVNKQEIAGGPIVQVSNFGTSKDLHIRFNARSGGLLKLESEFTPTDKYKTYEEYKKAEQAGIAYFEVYLPAWQKELFEYFMDENGSIDFEAVENCCPELLDMVGYRIPTEDKYSCAPLRCVGFMPKEAGDATMYPQEITEINDSDFDIDKNYIMRKDLEIIRRPRKQVAKQLLEKVEESYKKSHDGEISKAKRKEFRDLIYMFLDNPEKMRHLNALTESLYREHRKIGYTTKARKKGTKTYNDNLIVDMTLAVLTNEATADKILNPGGYDSLKKQAYRIQAYRNNPDYSWKELGEMTTQQLKKLSIVERDLTWVDTQVQFYKQNAAAASLIGVFAVNKVAHAVLEGDNICLNIKTISNDPIEIAGFTFWGQDGMMTIDPKESKDGQLIGKNLGSCVAASADAGKEDALSPLNINMTTVNILTSMVRLGMPFEKATLFLSQQIIAEVLSEFNRENLANYTSLDKLIEAKLDAYRKENNLSRDSSIDKEELSEEDLIEGIGDTRYAGESLSRIQYKTLLAFQKMKRIAEAMRKPTFATRFNSISSAVGPLIVDNLIMEHKIEEFSGETPFYARGKDGTYQNIDINYVLEKHPILKSFSQTVNIAKGLFSDMPTGSNAFRKILTQLTATKPALMDKLYRDKKLLDSFAGFYQSHLLVASGLIDANDLKDVIDNFPKEFNKKNAEGKIIIKEKYPENALIQQIQNRVSKKTGRVFLEIPTTGMDAQEKERLSHAWIDLHKQDPELSKKLFIYCFFRAGIGFSPKTFMALLPSYVKKRLYSEVNGRKVTYADTFNVLSNNFPTVIEDILVDQFIQNNWDDNKLVPWKGGKDTHYMYMNGGKNIRITDPTDLRDLADADYMKIKMQDKKVYLFKRVYPNALEEGESFDKMEYVQIRPLGDNKEYLEISTKSITKPLTDTTSIEEDNTPSDINEKSPLQDSTDETPAPQRQSESQQQKQIDNIVDAVMAQQGKSVEEAKETISKIKRDIAAGKNIKAWQGFLQRVFKQMNLDINKEETLKEFEKYC